MGSQVFGRLLGQQKVLRSARPDLELTASALAPLPLLLLLLQPLLPLPPLPVVGVVAGAGAAGAVVDVDVVAVVDGAVAVAAVAVAVVDLDVVGSDVVLPGGMSQGQTSPLHTFRCYRPVPEWQNINDKKCTNVSPQYKQCLSGTRGIHSNYFSIALRQPTESWRTSTSK